MVIPLTYMPRSFTSDAVSEATDSSEDSCISLRLPLRNARTADGATHPLRARPCWVPSSSYTSYLSHFARGGAASVFGKKKRNAIYFKFVKLISRLYDSQNS